MFGLNGRLDYTSIFQLAMFRLLLCFQSPFLISIKKEIPNKFEGTSFSASKRNYYNRDDAVRQCLVFSIRDGGIPGAAPTLESDIVGVDC